MKKLITTILVMALLITSIAYASDDSVSYDYVMRIPMEGGYAVWDMMGNLRYVDNEGNVLWGEPFETEETSEANEGDDISLKFEYEIIDDEYISITKYTGSGVDVVVPATIDDYPVHEISNRAFEYKKINTITLPDSIESIEMYAFANCPNLTSVSFLNGLISIGDYAFENCTSLENVVLPESITSIGAYAFSNCEKLTNMTMPKNVTDISGGVFMGCENLESVIIADGATIIRSGAFTGCKKLVRVEIPASVEMIVHPFAYCSSDLTIYGATGSLAEAYASENGYKFIATDNENIAQ